MNKARFVMGLAFLTIIGFCVSFVLIFEATELFPHPLRIDYGKNFLDTVLIYDTTGEIIDVIQVGEVSARSFHSGDPLIFKSKLTGESFNYTLPELKTRVQKNIWGWRASFIDYNLEVPFDVPNLFPEYKLKILQSNFECAFNISILPFEITDNIIDRIYDRTSIKIELQNQMNFSLKSKQVGMGFYDLTINMVSDKAVEFYLFKDFNRENVETMGSYNFHNRSGRYVYTAITKPIIHNNNGLTPIQLSGYEYSDESNSLPNSLVLGNPFNEEIIISINIKGFYKDLWLVKEPVS